MKYVLYIKTLDPAGSIERVQMSRELGKKMKEEEKKVKAITPAYMHADLSGSVQIVETDDIEELCGMIAFYYGVNEIKAVPILPPDRVMWIADEIKKLVPDVFDKK